MNITSDKKFMVVIDCLLYMRFMTDMFVVFDKPPYKNLVPNKVFISSRNKEPVGQRKVYLSRAYWNLHHKN